VIIRTQEELFRGAVRIKYISEDGIKVSKMFKSENIKAIFNGEVRRNGDIVEIKGKMFVEKSMECTRCLDEFIFDTEDSIQIFLKPSSMLPREEEIELKMEDLDDDFYEGEEFDFYDYMLRLAESCVPPFAVCSENCRGICRFCGENLNKRTCDCTKTSQTKTMDVIIDKILKNIRKS
jgi:uncharacterized protein